MPARGRLRIDADLARSYPTYRANVIYATDLTNGPSTAPGRHRLQTAIRRAAAELAGRRPADHPHIAAWRQTFSSFGAKPSRYPTSIESLLTRSLRAGPSTINLLVDAYNAVSIQHMLPIGGEDWDRLIGDGVLAFASGEEEFVVFHDQDEQVSHPRHGEVVWADRGGVTCRRWNWRQCRRTQLTEASTSAYFVLEALGESYPDTRLDGATDALAELLFELSPGALVERDRLSSSARA